MFFKKSSTPEYQDFAKELEKNLQQVEQAPLMERQAKQKKGIQHLLKAAEILEDMGLDKHAEGITQILEKFAWEVPNNDPATSGLTPEKMIANLEEKGWVFNAEDGEVIDVAEPGVGKTVEMQPDGELEVTDDIGSVADAATVHTIPDGMAMNPMNPINPGGIASLANKKWNKDWDPSYLTPSEQKPLDEVDLDIRHILKKK